uniref:ATP-dependent RNA helicase Ski2/MTR4 C-terminal domain-containing protein n=1 Tax=Haptolina ericina TaxID=156174 RepID=A0A7S3ERY1_9EUKA
MAVKLNPKQRKAAETELRTLKETYGDGLAEVRGKQAKVEQMEAEIRENEITLRRQWDAAFAWLTDYAFIADDVGTLTARGRACAAFSDGHPLILGTIISDNWLQQLSLGEVCAWLCLFLRDARVQELDTSVVQPPKPSAAFEEVIAATKELATILEVEIDINLSLMMLDWVQHKDITRVAQWVDPHMLGSFVKAVMRVASYLDVVKEVLIGLNEYLVHNKLDNHMDLLLGGLVTNESLYLRLAD